MTKIPPPSHRMPNPIEFLLKVRFPLLDKALQSVAASEAPAKAEWAASMSIKSGRGSRRLGQRPNQSRLMPAHQAQSILDAAHEYKNQLIATPPDQFAALIQAEKEKMSAHSEMIAAAKESQQFFNLPSANADFHHYCKCAYWTLDEAIALSFGRAPEIVNWKSISPHKAISPFARDYAARRDLAHRALTAGQLYDPVLPGIFLNWAKTLEIEIAPDLMAVAERQNISLRGWKELYDDLKKNSQEELIELRSKVLELTASLQRSAEKIKVLEQLEDAAPQGTPLKTQERENLQIMALIGAMRGFDYDPSKSRNTAPARIKSDFSSLGFQFSDDRIRDHLNAAKELLPGNWQEKWKRKPNTDKR